MILAAGLGTRLMPLTADIPKALVQVGGMTLLERAVRKLDMEGFSEIIVNVHHHGPKVIEFLAQLEVPGVKIAISDETDELLDTGGGILKARWFFEGKEPFLVYNVDIITTLSLRKIFEEHIHNQCLATLAVSDRETSRYLLFDEKNQLCGWKDIKEGNALWSSSPLPNAKMLAFSGIHVISPDIFNYFTETGRFSVVKAYVRLAASEKIMAFDHSGLPWFDLGKPEQLLIASEFLRSHPEIHPS